MPVHKAVGDEVFAGTINGAGAIEVEVRKLDSESTLSKIITLVAEAQEDSAPTQQFIDRFSQPYTYVVIGATLLAIILPVLFGNEPFSATLYRAMTLLVVASPCALIISTPASVLSAIAAGARNGVLFKGGAYLERIAEVTTVAFDKTGTLTPGRPVVTNVHPLTGHSTEELLKLAASAETLSEHHIAKALIERAKQDGIELEQPSDFFAIAGNGIQAQFEREDFVETVYIGNDKLFMDQNMVLSPAISMIGDALQKQGKTVMLVVRRSTVEDTLGDERDWEVVGFIGVADAIRPEAPDAVRQLHEAGVKRVAMLTGDNEAVANQIAKEVGIDEVYAGLMPEEKVTIVQKLVSRTADGHGGRRRQRCAGPGQRQHRHCHGRRRHRCRAGDGRCRADVERPDQAALHHSSGPQGDAHRTPECDLLGERDCRAGLVDHRGAHVRAGLCHAAAAGRGRTRRQHADRGCQRAAPAEDEARDGVEGNK